MTLYTATITLILIMDPLGNIPVFLSILKNYDMKSQRRIMVRESFIAFLVLLLFLFFGKSVMSGLGLSTSALSVAGAIVLFLISLRMIFPPEKTEAVDGEREEPFIVPIAIPLIAGPTSMAILMMWAARMPEKQMMLLSAVLIASFVFLVCILAAHFLMRILGRRVLVAVERLMGMILLTIAVQMFLAGILVYFK